MTHTPPRRALPITRGVAAQIREIRRARNWTAADLGNAMAAEGFSAWAGHGVVGNVERFQRESITIEEYTTQDGRVLYRARWRDSQGKSREKGRFPNRSAARRYGNAQEVARDNDDEVLDTRTTVGDILHTELEMRSSSIRHNSKVL